MTHKKKTRRKDKAVKAEPDAPQDAMSIAHSNIGITTTLSLAIELTSSSSGTGQKTSLFDLPLAMRTIVHDHVLAVDENTYEIHHAHYTTQSEWQRRHNLHRVTNIEPNRPALRRFVHLPFALRNQQFNEKSCQSFTRICKSHLATTIAVAPCRR